MRFRAIFERLVSGVLFWVFIICKILGVGLSSGQQTMVMMCSVWASALESMVGEIILRVGQALVGSFFIAVLLGADDITSVEESPSREAYVTKQSFTRCFIVFRENTVPGIKNCKTYFYYNHQPIIWLATV